LAGFFAEDADKPKVMQLTAADHGKTVKIASGKTFDLALEGNPSTGFQWQVGKIEGDTVMQTENRTTPRKNTPNEWSAWAARTCSTSKCSSPARRRSN